jgi:predicted glycosyltransferase
MRAADRQRFDAGVARLGGRVTALGFHPRLERLLENAQGVVAMGGYNTFCEILSMDKPAIIAPRTRPRLEQLIRAAAAEKLGLAGYPAKYSLADYDEMNALIAYDVLQTPYPHSRAALKYDRQRSWRD